MKVSIIIKALNEEANIARTVESCLAAAAPLGGEVILADSLSTDRTVEIASRYPIKIVQLVDPADRGCGTAPQLGYQHSRGEYVYLVDGDMVLHANFLAEAVAALDRDPTLGGIGGIVRQMNLGNVEFAFRAERPDKDLQQAGEVARLDCGGLYRRTAVDQAGYFSDRNLHSFEEQDLGLRLLSKGWRLIRLGCVAVDHYGHTIDAYRLLWRRLKSKYAHGPGELLRASLGRPYLLALLSDNRVLLVAAFVVAWWLLAAMALLWGGPSGRGALCAALVAAAPLVAISARKRSWSRGLYAVTSWHMYAIGTLLGLLRRRLPPAERIRSRVVRDIDADASAPRSPASSFATQPA